jgi:hypothetical protein
MMLKSNSRRFAALGMLVAAALVGSALPQTALAAEGAPSSQPASKPATDAKAAAGTMPVKPKVVPAHIVVQHILIGFKGSVPGKEIERTKDQAKQLAYEILASARKGDNFDELVKKWTDDSPPGIYGMSNLGVPPNKAADPPEYPRSGMVPAFGNVGFAMIPGNIGIADWDAKDSPYGWHIIKRLK